MHDVEQSKAYVEDNEMLLIGYWIKHQEHHPYLYSHAIFVSL